MRIFYLLLLIGFLFTGNANGQNISVTGADATTNAGSPFVTLAAAFTSINATAQTGNTIVITIINSTTEPAAGAILNNGVWTSLTIKPQAGAGKTIAGAVPAGSVIDLNGADNVTLDGSNNGTSSKDLTVRNTDVGGNTIRFRNDATNNTVKNTIVEGANASGTDGTILFGTTTGTGNSNNTINNCDIRDRSDAAGVPVNAVISNGSVGAANSNNTISACNIFNWTTRGVYVQGSGVGDGWTINQNNLYQTASRTATLTAITIQASSNGHTINGNNIGGSAANRSGTALTTTGAFNGILLSVGNTVTTNVQGNTISNLNISGGGSQTFKGIQVNSGVSNVNIGTTTANTIGGGAAPYDTIRVNSDADMIESNSAGVVNIENNIISNVSYYNAGSDRLLGIRGLSGTVSIKNNSIHDLKSNGSSTTLSFFPGGIWLSTTTAGANVEGNQVYNIAQTNSGTAAYTIAAIYVSGVSSIGTPTTIKKNKVYGITAVGTGTGTNSPRLWGMHIASGSATYTNNMLSVGTGAGLETRLNGIEDLGSGTNNYYFNSVYISGTTSAGSNNSYAYNRSGTATVELRDNIFGNVRTGGTGFHVAVANTNAAATGWTATASNYNDLYSTASATTAQWLGSLAANNRDLSGWKAAQGAGTPGSGGDANSVNLLPGFMSVTNLHIDPSNGYPHDNLGTPFGSIGDDIDGQSRNGSTPDLGADEFTGTPPGLDVSAQTITGIPASLCPNSSVAFSVTVKNESGTTLDFSVNNMSISLNITGASTQTLTTNLTTGTLAAGASQSYLLSPNANLSANGTHNMAAAITLAGEPNTTNNTVNASKTINGTAAVSLPEAVDFTGYTGANLSTVFPNWSEATGTTTPSGTTSSWISQSAWSSSSNTTAKINLSGNTTNGWIVGPKILAAANTQLQFDVAITDTAVVTADPSGMQGTDDKVVVRISTDCGLTYSDLFTFNAATTVSLTNVLTAQNISLSAYAGQTVIIAFYGTDGSNDDAANYDFHIDNINILNVYPIDAGATALALPGSSGCFGATQTVSVTVKNYGTNTLNFSVTPLTVTTNVTGAATASLSGTLSTGTLAPNATVNVPMSATLNMTAQGTYTFNAFTTITGDGNVSNDAMSPQIRTVLSLGGTYTVGSGGAYPTLTAAVAAYNAATCFTAPVIFSLTDASYSGSETFPLTINANANAGTNSLTIKPTLSTTAITGSSASAIFILNGADYVIIDGSTGSTANTVCPASAASRNLTITNTNTSGSSAVVWLQTAIADGATNNTIRNCNLTGNDNTQTLVGIGSGGSSISISSAGSGNNNNKFVNNNINKTQYGIYSGGADAGNKNSGTVINQNLVNAASPNNVRTGGILVLFEDGVQISGNNIANLDQTLTSGTVFGIALGLVPFNSTTTFTGDDVINATVTNNQVSNLVQLNSTGFSAFGIVVNSVTSGTSLIANNMIGDIRASSTPNDFSAAILAGGGTGSVTNIYFNTISMTGSRSAATHPSYALAIGGSDPTINIKNNILINAQTSTNSAKMYAIGTASSTFTNMTSDKNDLYVAGTNAFIGQTGGLGIAGTDRVALTGAGSWSATTGTDANSKNVQPLFIGAPSNLHLSSTPDVNNFALESTGATGTGIGTDIDCAARPSGGLATNPDIGADEFAGATPVCTAATLPYLERFDTPTVAPALPSCVTVQNVNGGNTWRTVTNLPVGDDPASYHNFMRLDYESDGITPADDWFYTRAISLTGGTSYRLRFHYRNSDGTLYVENLEVKYGLAGNAASMTTGIFSHTGINSEVWKDTLIDFTPAVSGNYFIGFHGFSTANQAFLCVDNVSVIITPTCAPPVDIMISSITSASGLVSFNSPGGTNFYLEYGPVGFTPGTGATAGGGTVIGPAATFPISISGLTPETPYDVYVRRDCGGGNFSPNSLPKSFKTIIGNDDAPGAYTLTLGAGCAADSYTNFHATAGTNEVFPSCSGSKVAPVWFKFVAPASGAVRIKTTKGTVAVNNEFFDDSKIGLFDIPAPSDVTDYTKFTIISCDEDGGPAKTDDDLMSVIYATGLTPAKTYYIAVDKFNSFAYDGTFCITVDELNNSMIATVATCLEGQTPFGSNATYKGWQPLVDSSSNLIALVRNPTTGGEVDEYVVSQNIAAVRTDSSSNQKYLGRNFMINNFGGATNVDVQFFFLTSELNALHGVDTGAVLTTLGATRQTEVVSGCHADFVVSNGVSSYLGQTSNGTSADGLVKWIRVTTPGFSNFYLHAAKTPVTMKTFLQGAYDAAVLRHKDVTTGWRNILRNNATSQPYNIAEFGNYNGGENVAAIMFNSTGAATDIVDWVLLELRNAAPPAAPIARRAAFILENGSIVDLDGTSPVVFRGVANGSYYVTIRHRNHLGIRTASIQVLDGALGNSPSALYDFTTAQNKAFKDVLITSNEAMMQDGSVFMMWAGNANADLYVRVTDQGFPFIEADAGYILGTILSGQPNGAVVGYSIGDLNMDGVCRATDQGFPFIEADAGYILGTVLSGDPNAARKEHK